MDNASKALVISGAVLISILLVATGVYVLNTQNPELFTKNASDKMWSGVDVGLGLKEKEEYEDMGENVEINTEGGNENSTTYLKPRSLLREAIAIKVEKLTFIDTNKYKPKEGALLEEDVGAIKNGEVMAYAYDSDGNDLYEVVVGQAGGVKANPNCFGLLSYQKNLVEINVKYLDTSNVTNMERMFDVELYYQSPSAKSKFTVLDLSNFDTSNVTNMNNMFVNCSNLTSLDISNFNTSNVTDMGGMFESCHKIEELDLSNFNTANVTDMSCMFYCCESLTNLDISNFNTSKVTNMSCMFFGCSKLTELDVSNFNTANVINMISMFDRCRGLTSLDLSNFNTSKVTYMGMMFMDCSNLEELTLGENFIIKETTDIFLITKSAHANTVAAINAKLPTT